MTDLTVRLVLTADGRPLRTEIAGASSQVEQFTRQLEQGGVRVERSSVQAEAGVRRIGASATSAGSLVAAAFDGRAVPAVTRLQARLMQVGTAAGTILTGVGQIPERLSTVANASGRMAAALSGGIAGVVVQVAAFGAQMLFAGRSTETAAQSEGAFTDAAEAVNAVLTTREERARRAANAMLDLATRTAQARIEGLRAAQADAEVRRLNVQRNLGGLERDLEEASPRNRRSVQSDVEEARRELANLEGLLRIQGNLLAEAEQQIVDIQRAGTSNLIGGVGGGGGRGGAANREDVDPFKRLREAGRSLEQDLRTPLERYNDQVQRLNTLLQGGFITQDTWYRGLARSREELNKAEGAAQGAAEGVSGLEAAFDRLIESSQGFGRETAKAAADALLGIKALDGGIGGLAQRLASGVIEKLIYEQITGPLTQAASVLLRSGFNALFAPTPISTGTPAQTNLGLRVVGGVHSGGIAGREATFHRAVPESLFADAPRLHSGGYIGSDEVPAILRRGEGVFTPEQMAALGPGTTVQIIDQRGAGAPPMQVSEGRGPDGRRIIRAIVRAEMQQAIADGVIDQPMQMAYGVSRAGMR